MSRDEVRRNSSFYSNFIGQKAMLAYSEKQKSNSQGEFVIDTLLPGVRFYIMAASADRRSASVPLSPLKPGEDRDLGTITLKERAMSTPKNEQSLFTDPGRAWEPYQPGPEAPWDAARVAHLHRRAGLGATWGQLQRDLNDGFEPSLRRILDGEAQGPSGQPASEFADTVAAMEESAQRRPSMERVQMLWLYRLIFTPFPLQEVMTLAWHGHYATSQAKVNSPELMLAQNNAQRTLWRAPISKLHLPHAQ